MTRHNIGGNNPPSPFEMAKERIDDLYEEAKHWLDGEEVNNEGASEGIARLLNLLRKAGKDADKERVIEKAPFFEAGKLVDARYKPLAEQAKRATDACKKALQPWLLKKEAEKREREDAARKAQEEAEAAARKLREQAQSDDLAAQEAIDKADKVAEQAKIAAMSERKASAGTKPDFGRAVSLRTSYRPELTDMTQAVEHYWITRQDRIRELLQKLAEEDVRGGKRTIPGFKIIEEKSAV